MSLSLVSEQLILASKGSYGALIRSVSDGSTPDTVRWVAGMKFTHRLRFCQATSSGSFLSSGYSGVMLNFDEQIAVGGRATSGLANNALLFSGSGYIVGQDDNGYYYETTIDLNTDAMAVALASSQVTGNQLPITVDIDIVGPETSEPARFTFQFGAIILLQAYQGNEAAPGSAAPLYPGPQGPPGLSVLNGSGAPANTTGRDGEFYLDKTNTILYGPKTDGVWPSAGVLLIGPKGDPGDVASTVTVANEAALFALTSAHVGVRDTVVVTTGISGGIEYYTVLDTTKLNSYAGYGVLRGGKAYFDGGKIFSDGLGNIIANKVTFPDMVGSSISNGGTGTLSLNASYTLATGRLAANGDLSATHANFSGNVSAPTATFSGSISSDGGQISSDGSGTLTTREVLFGQGQYINGNIYPGELTIVGAGYFNVQSATVKANRYAFYGNGTPYFDGHSIVLTDYAYGGAGGFYYDGDGSIITSTKGLYVNGGFNCTGMFNILNGAVWFDAGSGFCLSSGNVYGPAGSSNDGAFISAKCAAGSPATANDIATIKNQTRTSIGGRYGTPMVVGEAGGQVASLQITPTYGVTANFPSTGRNPALLANGALYSDSLVTTVNGTGGSYKWSQPMQGSDYKKVLICLSGYINSGTSAIAFPKVFTQAPVISVNTTGITPTLTTAAATLPVVGTAATGYIILEGF